MENEIKKSISPSEKKRLAERALRDLDKKPTEAQVRQRRREALEAEIAEANREIAAQWGADLEPEIRHLTAEYRLAQMLVPARFGSILVPMRDAVEAGVEAERSLRRLWDALAKQIEADLSLRLKERSQGLSPARQQELQRDLVLEAHGRFRKRWAELGEATGAKRVLADLPLDDDLSRGLMLLLRDEMARRVGARPEPFSRRSSIDF